MTNSWREIRKAALLLAVMAVQGTWPGQKIRAMETGPPQVTALTQAVPTGPNGSVHALAAGPDGALYMGGYFTSVGGVAAHGVAKWNGRSWTAVGQELSLPVWALTVQGQVVYAAGRSRFEGIGRETDYVAKWDGRAWKTLGAVSGGFDNRVSALAASGATVYAGGDFRMAAGTAARRIAHWTGRTWISLGSGIGAKHDTGFLGRSIKALVVSGKDLYAAGEFELAGGKEATNVARWNGNTWSPVGERTPRPHVTSLVVRGKNVYAGTYGTTDVDWWNESTWSPLGVPLREQGYVVAMAGGEDGLYVAGYHSPDGNPSEFVKKWDGHAWTSLGSGLPANATGRITAMTVSGGRVYTAGEYTVREGSQTIKSGYYVATWNGSTWVEL